MKPILLLLVFLLGCSAPIDKREGQAKLSVNQDSIDICMIGTLPTDSLVNILITKSREVIGMVNQVGGDSCILKILDVVSQQVLKSKEDKYLVGLDSLGKYSDGFLSESLSEVSITLFDESLDVFLEFLQSSDDTYLEQYLVDGLSMEISMQGTKQERLEIALSKISSEKNREFIKELFEKVDPEKFD